MRLKNYNKWGINLSDSKKDNDWNFEIDNKQLSKEKHDLKPILKKAPKAKKKLEVQESGQPERKSRRQMAREAGGTSRGGLDIVEAASHIRRVIASVIDLAVFLVCVAFGQLLSTIVPSFGSTVEGFLGPEIVSTIPIDIGGLLIAVFIHFLISIVPTASTQRSLGKKLMKIKIIGTVKPKPGVGVIFIREYIAKPISIFSVIGLLIIPLNKKHRGLHDFIAGTFLLNS